MGDGPKWIEQVIRVSKRRRVVVHWPSDISVREVRKLRRSIGPLVDFIEALAQPERDGSPGIPPGQTSEAKEGSATPTDVQETVEPGPVDGERSPARVTHVNDPEGEVEAEVPPSTWIPPEAAPPDPTIFGRVTIASFYGPPRRTPRWTGRGEAIWAYDWPGGYHETAPADLEEHAMAVLRLELEHRAPTRSERARRERVRARLFGGGG